MTLHCWAQNCWVFAAGHKVESLLEELGSLEDLSVPSQLSYGSKGW